MYVLAHEKRKSVEDKLAESKMLASVRRYQRFVSSKLAEFLQCDVHYTVRRVLPAETARMYRGNVDGMCRSCTDFASPLGALKLV